MAVTLGACGSSGELPSGPLITQPSAPSYEITVRNVPHLGTILVDGGGLTLYLFVPDKQSSHSTCDDVCALQWPPLVLPEGVAAPVAGPGVDPALLSVSTRTDSTIGGRQVNYNGWPLYTWPLDTAPGQATGQGLNNAGGLWYVLSPRGTPIT